MTKRSTGFEVEGVVVDNLKGGFFKVKLNDNDMIVTCTIAGRLRTNNIRIITGDKVTVEVSVDDVTKGRIVWRDK